MSFKTITIKHRVYKELSKAKPADESFSDMFVRLLHEKKPDLMEFAGAWKMSKEEEKGLESSMKEYRRRFDADWEKRRKRPIQ
ncbi:MAG: antitoxin VapB family protein [Nanoarchaeota archaeon]